MKAMLNEAGVIITIIIIEGSMNQPSLQHAVVGLLSQNAHRRTFSFMHRDQKYWVKQPDAGEANVWHKIMLMLSKLLKNNFFRPTVVTNPKNSLAYEARRLQELKKNGINVPEVMLHTPTYLVLEDAGTPLNILLLNSGMRNEEKKSLLVQLSRSLADMHNRGFYHSRPALRDMAYKEGKIYFMDFEENLENSLSTEEAIVRDGFLYAHTLYRKITDPELVETALDAYHRSLRPDLWDALTSEAQRYHVTHSLLKPIRPYLGKDGVAIFDTLKYFRQF
jgi:tRNA A-37 threonylcarbamoyl transferase component Bud32